MTEDPNKLRRERYLREGRCIRCGEMREDGLAKLCQKCIERGRRESRDYYQRKKAKKRWQQKCRICDELGHQARTCKKARAEETQS